MEATQYSDTFYPSSHRGRFSSRNLNESEPGGHYGIHYQDFHGPLADGPSTQGGVHPQTAQQVLFPSILSTSFQTIYNPGLGIEEYNVVSNSYHPQFFEGSPSSIPDFPAQQPYSGVVEPYYRPQSSLPPESHSQYQGNPQLPLCESLQHPHPSSWIDQNAPVSGGVLNESDPGRFMLFINKSGATFGSRALSFGPPVGLQVREPKQNGHGRRAGRPSHQTTVTHECLKCKQEFSSKWYFERHQREQHEKAVNYCWICKKQSKPRQENLVEHIRKKHKEECCLSCKNPRVVESMTGQTWGCLYQCGRCFKGDGSNLCFQTKRQLKAHNKQNHPYVCPYPQCGMTFKTPDELASHKESQHG